MAPTERNRFDQNERLPLKGKPSYIRTEEKLDVNDSLPPTEMFENNTCKDTKI